VSHSLSSRSAGRKGVSGVRQRVEGAFVQAGGLTTASNGRVKKIFEEKEEKKDGKDGESNEG
jgi:hypothetical protein